MFPLQFGGPGAPELLIGLAVLLLFVLPALLVAFLVTREREERPDRVEELESRVEQLEMELEDERTG